MKLRYFAVLLLLFLVSCSGSTEKALYQLSTISSLINGDYDGRVSIESLSRQGDFGIGTYHQLDGEMIYYHNEFYKVTADGVVRTVKPNETAPFATICWFTPTIGFDINLLKSIEQLDSIIQKQVPDNQSIYAVEIIGGFDTLTLRSVPKQEKPYKKMVEVAKHQSVFNYGQTNGALIGFYGPTATKDIMVKGLHLHFLSFDYKKGGHVLSFKTTSKLRCRIAVYSGIELDLHHSGIMTNAINNTDVQKQIEQIE